MTEPAGLRDTEFLRSDELPGGPRSGISRPTALRTNIFHLPVRGTGDGGAYTTAGDVHLLWTSLFAGRIVSPEWVAEMVRPRSDVPEEGRRYGLGFWVHESKDTAILVGGDTGVSLVSHHDPGAGATHTVISNTTDGAWPVTRLLAERLGAREPRLHEQTDQQHLDHRRRRVRLSECSRAKATTPPPLRHT